MWERNQDPQTKLTGSLTTQKGLPTEGRRRGFSKNQNGGRKAKEQALCLVVELTAGRKAKQERRRNARYPLPD